MREAKNTHTHKKNKIEYSKFQHNIPFHSILLSLFIDKSNLSFNINLKKSISILDTDLDMIYYSFHSLSLSHNY